MGGIKMSKMCPQQYCDPNFSLEEVAWCFKDKCMAWDESLGGCILLEAARVSILQYRGIPVQTPQPQMVSKLEEPQPQVKPEVPTPKPEVSKPKPTSEVFKSKPTGKKP